MHPFVLWAAFIGLILGLLALDLGVFNRKAHEVSLREAAVWSAVWVTLSLLFNLFVLYDLGPQPALAWLTGYLIEKALSVDNLFVFVIILQYFQVPPEQQHHVLFWGVLGALVTRGVFIVAGSAFLARFEWAIYVFGAILAATGLRLLLRGGEPIDPEKNPVVRLANRLLPSGHRTPLLLAIITVELTDIVFAVDSIPAIFAITRDPFIVYSSNVFAVLGLRSLYFLLAGVVEKFRYLKTGLAIVLLFVAAKMLLSQVIEVPIGASLATVALVVGASIAASLLIPPRGGNHRAPSTSG